MEGGTTMIKGGEKALPSQYITAPSMRFRGGINVLVVQPEVQQMANIAQRVLK